MNAVDVSEHECHPEWIDEFVSGTLSPDDQRRLEDHLSHCNRCDETLHSKVAGDEFWQDAKTFLNAVEVTKTESGLHASADVVRILDPTDDPDMMGRFAGYEISGIIGRGGMGIVMKGFDRSLNRYVAIKVLNPAMASLSAARQRFAREAQAAAAVVHDNVISIYGVDQWHDLPYLVMPYVRGESLQGRIDRTAPMSVENTLEVSMQVARGLSAAHEQGLIHRDIKPANILLPESVSRVVITDFGLARAADDATLTQTGIIAGTPEYMSPEQAKGQAIDPRTDLFSLGSVMYAMVTGRPPFRADSAYGVLHRINHDQQRAVSSINTDAPQWIERTIDRLLQKDPSDRFETAAELAEHLEDCLAHVRQPTTVMLPKLAVPSKPKSFGIFTTGRMVGLALAAILVSCLVFAASMLGWFDPTADPTAGQPEKQNSGSIVTTETTQPASEIANSWPLSTTSIERLEEEAEALKTEFSRPLWESLSDPSRQEDESSTTTSLSN